MMLHSLGLCEQLTFNAPSWSISAEAVMYVFAPLVFAVVRHTAAAAVAIVGVLVVLFWLEGSDWLTWTADGGAVRAIPSFILGALMQRRRDWLEAIPFAAPLYFVSLLCLGSAFVIAAPGGLLLALAYFAGISGMAADVQGTVSHIIRRLAPLGQMTYSIYMLHMLVLVASKVAAQRLLGLEGGAYATFMIAALLLLLPLSYCSLKLFEMPARRWIVRAASAPRPAMHHPDAVSSPFPSRPKQPPAVGRDSAEADAGRPFSGAEPPP
jgi:peptidoglycan/LPS O-acetylase OafA/YrhL